MRKNPFLIAGLVLLAIIVIVATVGKKNYLTAPTPQPIPVLAPDSAIAGWKEFQDENLLVRYKLPSELQYQHYYSVLVSQKPQTGEVVCLKIIPNIIVPKNDHATTGCDAYHQSIFALGALSSDYSTAGRESSFLDITGYKTGNNSHFIGNNSDSLEKYGGLNINEFTNADNFHILIIEDTEVNRDGVVPGIPPLGMIGAIVKLPSNSKFPGFAVEMKKTQTLTSSVFKQIVSSFKILQP